MSLAQSVLGVAQREFTDYLRSLREGDRHVVEGLRIYGGESGRIASHTVELTIFPGGAATYDLYMVFSPALTADEIAQLAEDGWKVTAWTDSETTCTRPFQQPATVS